MRERILAIIVSGRGAGKRAAGAGSFRQPLQALFDQRFQARQVTAGFDLLRGNQQRQAVRLAGENGGQVGVRRVFDAPELVPARKFALGRQVFEKSEPGLSGLKTTVRERAKIAAIGIW